MPENLPRNLPEAFLHVLWAAGRNPLKETGFQCAALTVLELMLFDKLALNSVMPLPLPPESWD